MGKIFFLVWITFNSNHTANLAYMGGHEYGSDAACMEVELAFNDLTARAMEQTTEEEIPEMEFACTTIAPDHSGQVKVVDIEYVSDETEFFLKAQ